MQTLNFLEAICKDNNILLTDMSGMEGTRGVALRLPKKGTRGIGYSDTLNGWPTVSVVAHELAHHVLGHLDDGVMVHGNNGKEYSQREQEARIFSAVFTAVAMFFEYIQKLPTELSTEEAIT